MLNIKTAANVEKSVARICELVVWRCYQRNYIVSMCIVLK